MNLILSRKGVDSGTGGFPSPIFPDGSMCSIPIQAPGARTRYDRIAKGPDGSLGPVVRHLSRGRIAPASVCHFDPDLAHGSLADRHPTWVPSLGQVNAAAGHLAKQGVGVGDVFLFFGWFRRVEPDGRGGWRFPTDAPDLHVIFGWVRVGSVIDVPADPGGRARVTRAHPWIADHPHLHFPAGYVRGPNRIYAAASRGDGGEFSRFDRTRVLTAPEAVSRGVWRVPRWFGPGASRPPLSYHSRPDRWTTARDHCTVRTVGRGQEFVLDCANRPEAAAWVSALTGAHGSGRTGRSA